MQFNVIGELEIAEELDEDDELEIEIAGNVVFLNKDQADDVAWHILTVLRGC